MPIIIIIIGCARERYPGVYARISSQYDWIKKTICQTKSNEEAPPTWCDEELAQETCSDSSLRFRVNLNGKKRFRDCKWVAKKPIRCMKPGVESACRLTCKQCSSCSDTSTVFKVVRKNDGKKVNRNCTWANNWRCENVEGLDEICSATCGKC